MDINATIDLTDKALSFIGVSRADVVLLVFVIIISVLFWGWRVYEGCRKTLSCERTKRALDSIEIVSKKVDLIHEETIANSVRFNNIGSSHDSFDTAIVDIKSEIAMLRGILIGMGGGTNSNRRIIHD